MSQPDVRDCAACGAAPIGQACSLEHAELVRDLLSLIAGRGEAEHGPDSTREPSRRASSCGLCAARLFHFPNASCTQ